MRTEIALRHARATVVQHTPLFAGLVALLLLSMCAQPGHAQQIGTALSCTRASDDAEPVCTETPDASDSDAQSPESAPADATYPGNDEPAGASATRSSATFRVRLTTYLEEGVTYGGGHTGPGTAACSWNFPMGTLLTLPNGETFRCNDRGQLGDKGWVDLWRRADLAHRYGDYVVVTISRWGP